MSRCAAPRVLVVLLACALAGALVAAAVFAAPSRRAHQMRLACAWAESGLLRYAARRSDCNRSTEKVVSIAAEAPVYACVSGRYRLSRHAGVHPRGTVIPLGTMWRAPHVDYCRLLHQREIALGGAVLVHLCAAQDGLLRYVNAARRCHGSERELFVPARRHRHSLRVGERPPGQHVPPGHPVVPPPSNPPNAYPQTLSDDEGVPLAITLTGAANPPGEPVSYEIVSAPAHGALTGVPPSVTYTPAAGYHGPDSFTFTVSDGKRTSAPATISITVNHVVDSSPVNAVPGEQSLAENGLLTFSSLNTNQISVSDSDSEGSVERVKLSVAHGSLSPGSTSGLSAHSGDGTETLTLEGTIEALDGALEGLVYAPAHDFHGSDSLSVETDDLGHTGTGGPLTAVSSVPIAVSAVTYDTAASDSYSTSQNVALSAPAGSGVLANDADADTPPLSMSAEVVSGPAHGALTLNSDGSFEYVPAHDFSGTDSFSYRDSDGNTPSNVATVTLAVNKVTYDTAVNDSYSLNENTTLGKGPAEGLLANDTDADTPPLPLSAEVVSGPAHGTLTLNSDGSFEYVPAHDFSGTDSFSYRDSDGNTPSNVATVSLSIEHVDRAPVNSVPGEQSLEENGSLTFSSLDTNQISVSDSDSEGGVEQVKLAVAHGTLALGSTSGLESVVGNESSQVTARGTVASLDKALEGLVYTPAHDFSGSDSLSVETDDLGHTGVGGPLTAVSSVPLTVSVVAYDTAVADSYSVSENGTLSKAAASGVLANDSDSNALPLEAVLVSGPSHGALTLNADGSFEYLPAHNYSGADSFTYKDYDGNTFSNTVTVTISVETVVYDTAVADSYSLNENETLSKAAPSGVLANDTESDSPALPLAAVLVSGPSHGTLTLNADGSFEYVPAHNYSGSDSFTYKDNDGNTDSNTVTVSLTVNTVTYDTAVADSYSLNENETLSKAASSGVLANDTESDSPALPLTAVLVSGPSHGTLTLNADGSFEYVPAHNYSGSDSFTYKDNDGNTDSNTVTVSLTVNTVTYDTAVADSYSLSQNETLSKNALEGVLANDIDSDTPALPLEAVLVSGPSHGTLALNADGSFEYVPAHNYSGSDSFTYKDNDGNTDSNTVTVSLTVEPVVYDKAVADNYSLHENETLSAPTSTGVLANDTDSDTPALPLEAVLVSGPSHGTLTLNADGSFEYTPSHNYVGSDSFTYKDYDGNTDSNTVTVTLTVERTAFDKAVADSYTTNENETLSKNASSGVLANDTDSESLPLEAVLVTSTSHGTLKLEANGEFTYVPDHNFQGTDSFTYKDNDGNTFSNTVTVTLTVSPVAYDTAVADSYTSNENETLSKAASSGVLANDTESDTPALPLNAVLVSGPSHGALTLNADGSFEYVPTHNFHGADSFTYKDNDGNTDSNTVTVTLAVEPVVYDAATADSYTAHENQTLSEAAIEGVLANDTDSDTPALPLEAVLVSGPSHGTLTLKSDGSFEYTPSHNYVGADSFTYKDNDGNTFSNTVTVSLTVEPVTYDTAVADSYTASENGTLFKAAATGVLTNDTDSDTPALPLEAVLVSGPSHGTLTLKSDGSFEYTPSHNYVGADSFTYKDNDGNTFSNTVTVSLTVEPVTYDTAVADSYSTLENATLSESAAAGVLANDTDSDTPALPLEAVIVKTTEHGTLTLKADGSFEYVPSSGFHGTDSFTYKDNDGNTDSNTATVTIEVTVPHVDEAPALTAPAEAKAIENTSGEKTSIVFSKASGNQIAMSDKDAEGGVEKLELAVSHGTLTPHSASGLTVTGSGTASLKLEGTLIAIDEGLEGLTYAPTLEYTGSDTLSLTANDLGHSGSGGPKTASASVSITVTAPNPTPINPTFTGAIGNTELSVGVARGAAPDVEKTGSVLPSPAEGPDKSSVAVTAETIKTAHEGTVSMNANGTFTYQPPVGLHAGADTFQYNETDSLGGKATGTATIEFNSHRVWYAKSQEVEAGNGESNKPFKSLASAEAASVSGDVIFLENSSSVYSGGIKLKSEQTLAGQDKELKIAEEEVMPGSGVYPIVEKPGSTVVTIESGDTVSGVEVKAPENDGVYGTGLSGAVTISNNKILGNKTNSKGSGIDLFPATSGTLLTLDVANNTIADQAQFGISLISKSSAHVDGTIAHNTIGERTVEGSGSENGGGMNIVAEGKSDTTTVEISENTVLSINHEGMGMWLVANEESGNPGAVLNATVLNNTIEMIDQDSDEGVYAESRNGETLCLHAKGNTIKAAGVEGPATFNADAMILAPQLTSTFKVQGLKEGAAPTNAEVEELLEKENSLSTVPGGQLVLIEAKKSFSPGTCPVP